MNPDHESAPVVDFFDYVEVFSRRKWLIAGAIAVGAAIGLVVSAIQSPSYVATAQVLVSPPRVNPTEAPQRTDQLVNMVTEREVASSNSVAELAAPRIEGGRSARSLGQQLQVSAVGESHVLRFSYTAGSPALAAEGANAFAQSYLDFRQVGTEQTAEQAEAGLREQSADIEQSLAQITATLAAAEPDSNEARTAQVDRDVLVSDLVSIRQKLATLSQIDIDSGEIIDPAESPGSPATPNRVLNVALGLLLGGLVGTALAFLRHRTDDRVSQRSNELELLGMRVLGTVPRPAAGLLTDAALTGGPEAEAYRRLTSNVLYLTESQDVSVLLVTSPNLDDHQTAIAGQLAVASARVGKRILLVSANLREPQLHERFGVSNSAGLVGVLVGEVEPAEAIRTVDRFPRLDILPAGPPIAQPAELLQTESFRYFISRQRSAYDLVIVEAPAVNAFADALAVASVADGVVLAVEDGTSTKADVRFATGQLQSLGAQISGAVTVSGAVPKRRSTNRRGDLSTTS